MTLRERVIVETYTGVCMVTGEDRNEVYKYMEELMGRPVYTHELASKEVQEKLKEKSRADFMALCREVTEFEWLRVLAKAVNNLTPVAEEHLCRCSVCGTHNEIWDKRRNVAPNDTVYCWHCGQAHRLEV